MKIILKRDEKLDSKIEVKKGEDGTLTVFAPPRFSESEIKVLLSRHSGELRQLLNGDEPKQSGNASQLTDKATSAFFTYYKCLIYGVTIDVVAASTKKPCFLEDGKIFVNEKLFSSKDSRRKVVQDFLKKTAKSLLGKRVSQIGGRIRMCPVQIDFKPLKDNLWLSCSDAAKRIVTIDFRVVQLPEHLQNFVILHCFSHFYEASHNQRFETVISNFLPNYKSCQAELDEFLFLKDI